MDSQPNVKIENSVVLIKVLVPGDRGRALKEITVALPTNQPQRQFRFFLVFFLELIELKVETDLRA